MQPEQTVTRIQRELIVTQWDVNQLPPVFRDVMEYELIVTQWDVNFDIDVESDYEPKN